MKTGKQEVDLFIWGRPMKTYAKELKKYKTSSATLQFPIGTKVPAALVTKLVKVRVRDNQQGKKGSVIDKRKRKSRDLWKDVKVGQPSKIPLSS